MIHDLSVRPMKNIKFIAIAIFISLIISLLLGGFIFGFVNADDCPRGLWGIFGRIFIGIIFAILNLVFYGFPPKNEGGVGEPFNTWLYVGIVFILIVPLVYQFIQKRRSNSRCTQSSFASRKDDE
jgi:hypothetical protein